MINCNKCSAQNTESRRFCRECGNLMVLYCGQCGFGNLQNDNYCGGCGINLSESPMPDRQPLQQVMKPASTGIYTYDDISDLIQGKTIKAAPAEIKREIKGTDSVSQDMLDSIFDETEDED